MASICNKLHVFLGIVLFVVGNKVYSLSLPRIVRTMEILDIQNSQPDANLWLAHHKIIDYLRKVGGADAAESLTSKPKLLHSFKWKNCDQSPSLLNLTSLNVTPDPLNFPGNVYLRFAGVLKETVDAPLKLKVLLKKEISTAFWIEVPCIGGIGSCTYDDMCETLQGATCPRSFVKYNVPCKCPFSEGSYKLLNSQFNANVNDVPNGNYYLKATSSYGQKPVACIEINFTVHVHN